MIQIKIKRAYENMSEEDGFRVFIDRLWPRGMKKGYLHYDLWAKEITPSPDLRKWFHEDIAGRWNDFSTMYQKELSESDAVKSFIDTIQKYDIVTLLYASKEPIYNHAHILKEYLDNVLN